MSVGDDVLEVMGSARSMRWLKDDPVDPELVQRVLWAGTRASSPNNTQPWDFVVVTSPEVKRDLQEAIVGASRRAAESRGSDGAAWQLPEDPSERHTVLGAQNLVANFDKVPVLIFVCGSNLYPEGAPILAWSYSAMYAAGQNMLVAARALGLGAAFTTFHQQAEPEIRKILAIPDDRIMGVTMPLGWPARPFGPVTRRPVEDVVHSDGW